MVLPYFLIFLVAQCSRCASPQQYTYLGTHILEPRNSFLGSLAKFGNTRAFCPRTLQGESPDSQFPSMPTPLEVLWDCFSSAWTFTICLLAKAKRLDILCRIDAMKSHVRFSWSMLADGTQQPLWTTGQQVIVEPGKNHTSFLLWALDDINYYIIYNCHNVTTYIYI